MPGDFRLIYLQYFDEKADANFIVSNQINQSQTRVIGKRFEEKCNAVFFLGHAGNLSVQQFNYYDLKV